MSFTKYPLSLTFKGGTTRSFVSPSELAAWLDAELEVYGPLTRAKLQRSEEPLSSLLTALVNVKNARDQVDQAETFAQSGDKANYDAVIASLMKRLTMAYTERGILPAPSVEVQALVSIAKNDPVAALAALYALSDQAYNGQPLPVSEPAVARGISVAAFIRYQLFGTGPSEVLTGLVDATVAELQRRAEVIHGELAAQLAQASALNEQSKQAWERSASDQAELTSKLTQSVETSIGEAAKNIEAFKTGYHAEIALKQPVEFWEKKGGKHTEQATRYGIASLACAAALGGLGFKYLPEILKELSYGGIATAVLLSTLGLWLIRVLVRSYMSQTHLGTDAEERVAMVKTYLALMESGKAPADTLGPVLTALFRPASDGIVKDDSMPLGIAELLTKQNRSN